MKCITRKLRLVAVAAAVMVGVFVWTVSAQTMGTFTDARDGKKYKTVKIWNQTWMAENLNYQTGNSWCYGGDNSNCQKYGRLYDWNTAKSVCPSGWHLPSQEVWGAMVKAVGVAVNYGDNNTVGKVLKSTNGWDGNGTDGYGFSALPGGYRSSDGSFKNAGEDGYWWTATEIMSGYAYYRSMDYYDDGVYEFDQSEDYGYSVRCVKN